MRIIIFLFLFISIVQTQNLHGQSDSTSTSISKNEIDSLDDVPKSPEIELFKNIIKINPLLFISGDIPIYYERVLSGSLSLELGVGITTRNYTAGFFREDIALNFDSDRLETIPGFSYKVMFRYYFDEFAPEDLYLSSGYGYRKYVFEYTQLDETGAPSSNTFRTNRIINEFMVITGNQIEFYKPDGFFWEYYTGFGLLFIEEVSVTEESVGTSVGNADYTYILQRLNDVSPTFYIGLKLGYAF